MRHNARVGENDTWWPAGRSCRSQTLGRWAVVCLQGLRHDWRWRCAVDQSQRYGRAPSRSRSRRRPRNCWHRLGDGMRSRGGREDCWRRPRLRQRLRRHRLRLVHVRRCTWGLAHHGLGIQRRRSRGSRHCRHRIDRRVVHGSRSRHRVQSSRRGRHGQWCLQGWESVQRRFGIVDWRPKRCSIRRHARLWHRRGVWRHLIELLIRRVKQRRLILDLRTLDHVLQTQGLSIWVRYARGGGHRGVLQCCDRAELGKSSRRLCWGLEYTPGISGSSRHLRHA